MTRLSNISFKLTFGFSAIVAIIAVVGVLTTIQVNKLGNAIDIMLRENYRSVRACQEMSEALEKIDNGLALIEVGDREKGEDLVGRNIAIFRAALSVECNNITVPGEQESVDILSRDFASYQREIAGATNAGLTADRWRIVYSSNLQPQFRRIKKVVIEILVLNQQNMYDAKDKVRTLASTVYRRLLAAVIAAALLSALLGFSVRRWILRPVARIQETVALIRDGTLDLVLESASNDELGRLSASFNEMIKSLRRTRKTDQLHLQRSRRALEQTFKVLPEAIAIFDLDGKVEAATESAERIFLITHSKFFSAYSRSQREILIIS